MGDCHVCLTACNRVQFDDLARRISTLTAEEWFDSATVNAVVLSEYLDDLYDACEGEDIGVELL